jgi:hypothetical protein
MIESADQFTTPFAVECSNDPNCEEAAICRFFEDLREAQTFAEVQAQRFRAVWLCEIGFYETRQGLERTDWIYFWWSEGTNWGECSGRRMGYPCDYQSELTSYEPLVDREAKKRAS